MGEFLLASATGVLACAVWFGIETAARGLRTKLTKKERRSPAKGRRSDSNKGE
jgi:hypothetical protein